MERSARILHAALLASSTLGVAFLALVRRLAPTPALPAGTGVTLRYVALAVAAGAIVGIRVFRARIPASPAEPDDVFWKANLGPAIVTSRNKSSRPLP